MSRWIRWSAVAVLLSLPRLCFGHFLWIVPETAQTAPGKSDAKVHLYFSESASPDDPELLKKVKSPKLWWRNPQGTLEPISLQKGEDSLEGKLPAGESAKTFGLSHVYGAMTRGKEPFLLKYHAKAYSSSDPATWTAISQAEALPLEIVPFVQEGKLALRVLWQGKSLPKATVTIEGPGIEKREGLTNEQGIYSTSIEKSGLFSIRAKHAEAIKGMFEKDAYSSVKHYATLSLPVDVARLAPPKGTVPVTTKPRAEVKSPWPQLDVGLTSFGAAIVGDDLYIYGGQLGKAHSYAKEEQTGELRKLNLRKPGQWQVISTGPRRTGLAMVAYGGKLYRVGGFEAHNSKKEPSSLWSMPDFARFDPQTGKWEDLPPLPSGRSSHDAVVAGNYLYVAGGWELKGVSKSSPWHETALRVDLSQPVLKWETLPKPPFARRALTLAEWQGKIYVIGGMEKESGPTTEVAIYDPQKQSWSEGPELIAEDMGGFGASAFPCGNKLWVSTVSGTVQTLTADGSKWVQSGKLVHPRFFHRMLPLDAQHLIVVGGAGREGKVRELESVSVTSLTPR